MAEVIIGIGTDIAEIKRIRKAAENPRFLQEYFSEAERVFLAGKGTLRRVLRIILPQRRFLKALGTGVRGFALSEVTILRDTLGAPVLL